MIPRESRCFSSVGSPKPLILPGEVQDLLTQIHGHCSKIPVAKVGLLPPPLYTDYAAYPLYRNKLRDLRSCATTSTNSLKIPPSFRKSLATKISEGLPIIPHQWVFC